MNRVVNVLMLSFVLLIGCGTSALARVDFGFAMSSRVTEFTAVDTPCELLREATVTVDDSAGITYTNGEVVAGILTSDNPMFSGTSMIVLDSETNHETEETELWVTAYVYPEMVNGAFIAPGSTSGDGPNVIHSGHGTRELQGLRIRFEADVEAGVDLDPAELPCEPLFPPVVLTGVIVDMGYE